MLDDVHVEGYNYGKDKYNVKLALWKEDHGLARPKRKSKKK